MDLNFQRTTALLCALLLLFCAATARAGFTTVVLDPGHGGHDRGGIPGQRLTEKIFTLDIARRVAPVLRASGLRVVMTRDSDVFVPLALRVAAGDIQRNAVFVSIHLNAGARPGAHGYETYYYSRQSLALASAIHARLGRVVPFDNRGIKRRRYYVLRHSRIPAVLTESGFLTSPEEGRCLLKSAYRDKLAHAIAAGIIDESRH